MDISKLVFRKFEKKDLPSLKKWGSPDDVRLGHYTFNNYTDLDLQDWYKSKQRFGVRALFGVFYEGVAIAFITLKNRKGKYAEMGIGIDPSFVGRGLSEPIIQMYLEHIYENYRIDSIGLLVASFNERAISAYVKSGFYVEDWIRRPYEDQSNATKLRMLYPEYFSLEKDGYVYTDFVKMVHKKGTHKERAYAKINLQLDVLGRQSNGYHDLLMIMQTIDLHDTVLLRKAESSRITQISRLSDAAEIPLDESNLMMKALRLMQKEFSLKSEYEINIIKRIPNGAGLAGGSSDAAAVIRGINTIEKLGLSLQQMEKLGLRIGADVPFCIRGGLSIAEGVGEKLTLINPSCKIELLLVKPRLSISTKEVFQKVVDFSDREIAFERLKRNIKTLQNGDLSEFEFSNELLEPAFRAYPTYKEIYENITEKLRQLGAIGVMMSGSGSAIIGIFTKGIDLSTEFDTMLNNDALYTVYRVATLNKE